MDKGEYRRMAAELGLVIVCPDTSPRGEHVADEPASWQLGKGAGFYVDATEGPWAPLFDVFLHHPRIARPGGGKLSRRHDPAGHFRPFDGRGTAR